MKTIITSPFLFNTPSDSFLGDLLAGAGISGIEITGISTSANVLTIEASRHLTEEEKGRVVAVLMGAMVSIQDA